MARIIRTTNASDLVPKGFPVLVDEKLVIIEAAFDYLLEIATLRGRSASPLTVQAYAEQLLDWFDSLEQSGIHWLLVTRETLATYRRRHETKPSPVTGRRYATATINGRLRTVCRFYTWAAETGWMKTTPFPTEGYRSIGAGTGFLAHTRRRGKPDNRNPLALSERRAPRRALNAREVRGLIAALAEPYRTMAVWAVASGMRRMEMCGLTTAQIPDAIGLRERDAKLIQIELAITKGGGTRRVHVPLKLIDRTHRFIRGARAEAAKARRGKPNQQLFLGPRGAPVTHNRASKEFHKGFLRASVHGDLHCLRHTFAVRAFDALTKRHEAGERINVMMALRDLLGHSSVAVTETYLSSIEIRPEAIEPALTSLYGATIGDEPSQENNNDEA